MTSEPQSPSSAEQSRARRWPYYLLALFLAYFLITYVLIPAVWEDYEHRHPSFDNNPRITQTSDGHPGDPLNVALIGTEQQVNDAMHAAKWFPASALGLKSDLKIAADTVLSRPDVEAPVSSLYLFGRKEDLAFEQPVGDNPRQRNHVRFWRTKDRDPDGRPTWIGSASYDKRVGLSHTTGQITHHIAPDVDAERDHLMEDLKNASVVDAIYGIEDFHTTREGKNGGGDPWHTDGWLFVAVIDDQLTEEKSSPESQ